MVHSPQLVPSANALALGRKAGWNKGAAHAPHATAPPVQLYKPEAAVTQSAAPGCRRTLSLQDAIALLLWK
eukprot:7240495-Pyramimonas_sp.AAC.1